MLKRRIGYLKAIVTSAHKILRLLWHLVIRRECYEEAHRPETVFFLTTKICTGGSAVRLPS
jgi:hypothetical protein